MNSTQYTARATGAGRTVRAPDFSLTAGELREVTAFALAAAAQVLPLYESASPGDERPRRAIEAAREFAGGAPRSKVQRTTAPAAHRAAKQAPTPAAFHAAMAAGDAAASAYLHPLADAFQVGHILRAAAHAAAAAELTRPGLPHAAAGSLERSRRRATPTLTEILGRYPATRPGTARVAQLTHQLDAALRDNAAPLVHPAGKSR